LPAEFLDEQEKLLRELGRDASNYLSRLAAFERTSLDRDNDVPKVSVLLKKFLDLMTEERKHRAGEIVRAGGRHSEYPDQELTEHLDMHFAAEVLDKLEMAVTRASALQKLQLDEIPTARVRVCFEEAHRCYLYGFHLACAILCRTILEAALEERVGRDEDGRKSIEGMVNKDSGQVSKDDRPQCAREIAKAGNLAVHEPEKFNLRYSQEGVERILLDTRKILESLYSPPD
jgi:hypothetical protein